MLNERICAPLCGTQLVGGGGKADRNEGPTVGIYGEMLEGSNAHMRHKSFHFMAIQVCLRQGSRAPMLKKAPANDEVKGRGGVQGVSGGPRLRNVKCDAAASPRKEANQMQGSRLAVVFGV